MTTASVLLESQLPNLHYRGKVRDTYDLGEVFDYAFFTRYADESFRKPGLN